MRLEIGGKPKNGRKKYTNNPRHDQWDFRGRKYFQRKHASLSFTCMIRSMIRAWIVLIEINV